jgi:hypothetical protein
MLRLAFPTALVPPDVGLCYLGFRAFLQRVFLIDSTLRLLKLAFLPYLFHFFRNFAIAISLAGLWVYLPLREVGGCYKQSLRAVRQPAPNRPSPTIFEIPFSLPSSLAMNLLLSIRSLIELLTQPE